MSKWHKVKAVYVEIVGEDWSLKTLQKVDIELSGEVDILQLQKDLKLSVVSAIYNFKHRKRRSE